MVYVALILSTLSCHLSSLKGRVLDLRHVGVAGPLELSPHSPSLFLSVASRSGGRSCESGEEFRHTRPGKWDTKSKAPPPMY